MALDAPSKLSNTAEKDAMANDTTDDGIGFHLTIAEQIAPTWARRHAEVEQASAAVREWLLAALDPTPGQTLLELS